MKYKKYRCIVCDWVYDEYLGDTAHGIEPCTRWEDIPQDWVCPDCGATKDQFEMIEI